MSLNHFKHTLRPSIGFICRRTYCQSVADKISYNEDSNTQSVHYEQDEELTKLCDISRLPGHLKWKMSHHLKMQDLKDDRRLSQK